MDNPLITPVLNGETAPPALLLQPHAHNGVDSPKVNYNDLINIPSSGTTSIIFWGGQALGGSVTAYFGPTQVGTTEASIQIQVPRACTLNNFYTTTYSSQGGGGSYTLTIRKNAADTAVVITIPAGTGAGFFSDTTHSATFAAGDKLTIKAVNASSSPAASTSAFSFQLT